MTCEKLLQFNVRSSPLQVKCGEDHTFQVPRGWDKIECKTMAYPDFEKEECYCLGDPRLTKYDTTFPYVF